MEFYLVKKQQKFDPTKICAFTLSNSCMWLFMRAGY